MTNRELSSWFWIEILKRPAGCRFVVGNDGKSRPDKDFAIVMRHAKILLKNDGLDPFLIQRVLLAMVGMGKNVSALTTVRWEFKPGCGRSFYSLVTGDGTPMPHYDDFGQLLL